MKKKYIAPSMMAIRIKTAPVLNITSTNVDGLGVKSGTNEDGITEGGSRRGDLWDDEDY